MILSSRFGNDRAEFFFFFGRRDTEFLLFCCESLFDVYWECMRRSAKVYAVLGRLGRTFGNVCQCWANTGYSFGRIGSGKKFAKLVASYAKCWSCSSGWCGVGGSSGCVWPALSAAEKGELAVIGSRENEFPSRAK